MANARFGNNSINNNAVATTNPSFLLVNPVNQINSVKLGDDNFLLWHLQVIAGIRGLGLEIFILENPPIPLSVIFENGSGEIINPQFISWNRQDQLLFSFFLSSMTEAVQGQMIGCDTSSQLWLRITKMFASRSKAKVMQYKLQLQTTKKGQQSMKYYLSKMKNIMDTLAVCGHSIKEDDQILYVLSGIGLEYDSVVVHITSRTDTLTMSDVAAILLAHECRLESYNLTLKRYLIRLTQSHIPLTRNRIIPLHLVVLTRVVEAVEGTITEVDVFPFFCCLR